MQHRGSTIELSHIKLSIKGEFEYIMEARNKIATAKIIVVEETSLLIGLTSLAQAEFVTSS